MGKLSVFVRRKIKTDDGAEGVDLVIRVRAGVVDVLVVGVELNVSREREKAAGEQTGDAPFGELALVSKLGGSVGAWMVRVNRHAVLGGDAIAIGPVEGAIRPIKIGAISVREKRAAGKGNMEHDERLEALDGGLHGRRKIAVAHSEDHRQALDVVEIENSDLLQLFEGLEIELKARADLGVVQVAVFHVALGLNVEANIGCEAEVGIDFGEIGGERGLRVGGGTAEQEDERNHRPLNTSVFPLHFCKARAWRNSLCRFGRKGLNHGDIGHKIVGKVVPLLQVVRAVVGDPDFSLCVFGDENFQREINGDARSGQH